MVLCQWGKRYKIHGQVDQRLNEQVESFWKLEAGELLSDTSKCSSVDDRKAIELWDNTRTITEGHHAMGIPFKNQLISMENNKIMLIGDFAYFVKRLQKDPELLQMYCDGIQSLLDHTYADKSLTMKSRGMTAQHGTCHTIQYFMTRNRIRFV